MSSGTTKPGRHTVEFSVTSLPLLEGRFAIDVSLTSATGEILQQIERVVEFSVFPDGRGIGPVAVQGEWSVVDLAHAEAGVE